jgi:hypothetical protein
MTLKGDFCTGDILVIDLQIARDQDPLFITNWLTDINSVPFLHRIILALQDVLRRF